MIQTFLLGSLLSLNLLNLNAPLSLNQNTITEEDLLAQGRPEYCQNLSIPHNYQTRNRETKTFADLTYELPTSFFEIYFPSQVPGHLDREYGLAFYHQSYSACIRNNQNTGSPILGQVLHLNLIYADQDVQTGPSNGELRFVKTIEDSRGRLWGLYEPNSVYEVHTPRVFISLQLDNGKFAIIGIPIIFDSNNQPQLALTELASVILNTLDR